MVSVLHFVHLLAIVVWVGSIIFFSLIVAPAIFKSLPRETAGDLIAKIFPRYYQIGCVCGVLSFVTLLMLSDAQGADRWRLWVLGLMSILTFFSTFRVGPKVRQLKSELKLIEVDSEREEKQKQFSRLHGFSMVLNMLVLILGLVFIGLTALRQSF